MKKIGAYFVLGCVVAFMGIIFTSICGSILSGMDLGSAANFGIGIYLCVVIVTCTGIIISKNCSKPDGDNSDDKEI